MSTPIKIVETPQFQKDADLHLTAQQTEAVRQLVASNPAVGDPEKDLKALHKLMWKEDLFIYYLVSTDLNEIILVGIITSGPDGPEGSSKEEDEKIRKALEDIVTPLSRLGFVVAIRELVKTIIDVFLK